MDDDEIGLEAVLEVGQRDDRSLVPICRFGTLFKTQTTCYSLSYVSSYERPEAVGKFVTLITVQ